VQSFVARWSFVLMPAATSDAAGHTDTDERAAKGTAQAMRAAGSGTSAFRRRPYAFFSSAKQA